jgi:sorbitol/mannitol transport system substrate-binding protein
VKGEVMVKALKRWTALAAVAGLTLTAVGCAGAGSLGASDNQVTIALVSKTRR